MKENEDGGTKERTGTGYKSADQGAPVINLTELQESGKDPFRDYKI